MNGTLYSTINEGELSCDASPAFCSFRTIRCFFVLGAP